jgi:hypothetical protein
MGSDKKWYLKMAVIGIILMITALTCNVNLTNPTAVSVDTAATFSALGTQMAGTQEGPAQPVPAGETPSVGTTTESRPPVTHSVTPPEPPKLTLWITDKSDLSLAGQHRANGGENFDQNQYERPFTSGVMEYLPDLDITSAEFNRSGDWVFINLIMAGQNAAGGMKGVYGIEVDSNMNGRGDFIIYVVNPTGTTWQTVGVKAYEDTNKDVGGSIPITSDIYPGNGYDTLIFDEGYLGDPDAAWARINPSNPSAVQLVFKHTLIRNNDKYMWGAFAGLPEMLNPAWFDYNDHFTHAIAGSPLSELTNYYPLKAFYGWDNTCKWVVGMVNPKGTEPGLCPYTPPQPTNTKYTRPTLTKRPIVNSFFWWIP